MITKEGLRTYFSDELLKKAEEYKNVSRGKLELKRSSDGTMTLKGRVDARDITIIFTRDGNSILDYNCPCHGEYAFPGMCFHTAVLLEQMIRDIRNGDLTVPDSAPSAPEITELLKTLENAVRPLKENADVRIIPRITLQDNAFEVQFSLKRAEGRSYVIKSIDTFAKNMLGRERVKYGKDLTIDHTMEEFEETSRPMVSFLKDLCDKSNSYRPPLNNSYSVWARDPEIGRSLTLSGIYLDLFMDAAENLPLMKNETIYTIREQKPVLKTEFRKNTENGYNLMIEDVKVYEGKNWFYVPDEKHHIIQKWPKEDQAFSVLLSYAKENRGKTRRIGKSDLGQTAKVLFPLLKENTELIDHDSFRPEDYAPRTAVFRLYLDAPDKSTISAKLYACYDENERYNLFQSISPANRRDAEAETRMFEEVLKYFNTQSANSESILISNSDDMMYTFMKEGIPSLQKKAEVYISESLKKLLPRPSGKTRLGVSVSGNLLQLNVQTEDISLEDLAYILKQYEPKKRYYRLKNGEFLTVEPDEMDQLRVTLSSLGVEEKELVKGTIGLPAYRAAYIASLDKGEGWRIEQSESFRNRLAEMEDTEHREYPVPESFHGELRPYQKEGYRWLCALRDNGFAGLLADEMGLGKTIQVIAYLSEEHSAGRSLIVCPASLVYNWNSEILRFNPELNPIMLVGTAPERKALMDTSDTQAVFITSYSTLVRDMELYENQAFDNIIVDEAQYIKNADTQTAKAVKAVNASFHIALTGTPIENTLSELWSIFDFLLPGFLYHYRQFRKEFEIPIARMQDDEASELLGQMIKPFTLRRLKKDVLKDLPEKLEEVYYAPLTGKQKELYEAWTSQLRIALAAQSDADFNNSKIELLAEITRLRQLCCSPSLIYENYDGESAKTDLCLELIERAVNAGHKVLLFSQFKTMLELLREKLTAKGIQSHILTGATPKEKRAEMTTAFQTDDIPVFCISLKAGGTGLNLSAADVVIHYDPWWNTAAENQASDRAHRIGQTNVVTVMRLILKDTIEDRILEMQKDKAGLSDRILSSEGISSAALSRDDLMKLL